MKDVTSQENFQNSQWEEHSQHDNSSVYVKNQENNQECNIKKVLNPEILDI